MDDLILFIIFIIFSILSYFNKKKENEPGEPGNRPEFPENDKTIFEFDTFQNKEQFEEFTSASELAVRELETEPDSPEIITQKLSLESSVHHHDEKSLKSTLKSRLNEDLENDAYALRDSSQVGPKNYKTGHPLSTILSKRELKRSILLKEVLDRPRAFDI